MLNKYKIMVLVAFSIFILNFPLAALSLEIADSPCYECHDETKDTFSKGTVHEPVTEADCESCHEDHGDEEQLLLTEEVPVLCFNCHDELSGVHKHEPVADGSCLDCHLVHNSDNSSLLSSEAPGLCYKCHDELTESHKHEPVADGSCLDCHLSHDSANSGLLVDAVPDLCYECHDEPDHSKEQSMHEPVTDGECLECHAHHESGQAALLTGQYNLERYVMYNSNEYELCFSCHDQELFEDEKLAEQTEFTNGDVNLHFLHVSGKMEVNKYGMKKKKEGMTCNGCHLVHGSEQPKLVRYNLECGKTYCYTINFRKFDGGGSCVVGCHKPKVYKNSSFQAGKPADDDQTIPSVAQKGKSAGSVTSQ